MDYSPREYQLSIETTLPMLMGNPGYDKCVNIGDMPDCTLTIHYWGYSDKDLIDWNWEVAKAEFSNGTAITEDSDPLLWKLVMRGVKYEDDYLNAKILERIREAA